MCRPASLIVEEKNKRAVWSKYTNSHTEIRKELELPENTHQRIYNVAVEISPDDGDLNTPINDWVFRVDQDILPDWWDAEEAEKVVRRALVDWAASWLVTGEAEHTKNRTVFVLNGGTVQKVLSGGTVQEVWAGGTVQDVLSGGTVREVLSGGTVQKVWDGGTVQAVWDGGTVQEVWDGGTVQAYTRLPLSILKAEGAVLVDRSGDSVVCHVFEEAKV